MIKMRSIKKSCLFFTYLNILIYYLFFCDDIFHNSIVYYFFSLGYYISLPPSFVDINNKYPTAVPVTFITTSSTCMWPRWERNCAYSRQTEKTNPNGIQQKIFFAGLKTLGRRRPKGIIINIFPITYALLRALFCHVSPKIKLIVFLEPGGREK